MGVVFASPDAGSGRGASFVVAESLFNVVVERPRATGPDAATALAAAISARYGIPAADLERRLVRGKFRVKSRVDRATAEAYVVDLTRLGAVCVLQAVEPATPPSGETEAVTLPQVVRAQAPRPASDRGPRVSAPDPRPASDRGPRVSADDIRPPSDRGPRVSAPDPRPASDRGPRVSAADLRPPTDQGPRVPAADARPPTDRGPRVPAADARPPTDRSPRLPLAPPPEPVTSGNPLDLGALSGGFNLTLSTLDGANPDATAGGAAARVAQSASLPASFGPAPTPAPTPTPQPATTPSGSSSRLPRAGSAPAPTPAVRGPAMPVEALAGIDRRFEPPRGEGEDAEVVLDTAMPSRRERGPANVRITGASVGGPGPIPTHTPVPLPPRVVDVTSRPGMIVASASRSSTTTGGGLRDARVRMVVGAMLAVGLGFVPAHIVGTMREQAAYNELDRDLARREASIRTREDFAAFDAVRDSYAARKRSARTNIVLVSLLVWAAVGGGVAWLWFRKVDWDHVLGPAR